jgi:hypothetical protein
MFEKARASYVVPDDAIELSVSDVEVVNLMREEQIEVPPADLPKLTQDDPVELSVSDVEVVKFMREEPKAARQEPTKAREPTNPCITFERTFAAEIAKALAPAPPAYFAQGAYFPPRTYQAPRIAYTAARRAEPIVPMPRALPTRAPRRRRSLIPRATLLMGLVVLAGVLHDEARAGRFDRVLDAASAFVSSVRR